MQPSVEYLGYRVDMHGLHAIEKKVEAIRNAPAPENQQQLRSFLGMVKFVDVTLIKCISSMRGLRDQITHQLT